ncbi:hypothetical protein DVH24_039203 [Malus domestica]|uniref:Uncharacterized protein n=1 Tax=Malus domestica TaxID=3750 RepID=A0A498K9H3_MALDO|nr:hypothetical protein DVH24_039203 [Malus domestica]
MIMLVRNALFPIDRVETPDKVFIKAMCQMESAIIGRCVFKNKSATIPIYADISFMELCFELTYVVPDHPLCLLKIDLDVRVLHLSLVNDKQNFVTINVNKCQSPCEGDSGGVNGNRSCGSDWNVATPSNTYLHDWDDVNGKYTAPLPQTYLSSHPW